MPDPFRKAHRELSEDESIAVYKLKLKAGELWKHFEIFPSGQAIPPSREISLAKTKLEEAVMWAVKAITG